MRKPDKSEKRIKELEAQVEGLNTMNNLLRQSLREKDIPQPELKTLLRDADIYRQWFDAIQDQDAKFLEGKDYQAAINLYGLLGMRIPHSLKEQPNGQG